MASGAPAQPLERSAESIDRLRKDSIPINAEMYNIMVAPFFVLVNGRLYLFLAGGRVWTGRSAAGRHGICRNRLWVTPVSADPLGLTVVVIPVTCFHFSEWYEAAQKTFRS